MLIDKAWAIDAEELFTTDPLLSNVEMPFETMLSPFGFPLNLSTNSPAVIAAADISWGCFKQKNPGTPLELCIGVTQGVSNSPDPPPVPVVRMLWGQIVVIADANNFMVIDLNAGRAFGWITQSVVESSLYFRYYLMDGAILYMISALRAGCLHAACVSAMGRGMLLCGPTAAGKSTLAYAGARTGWTLVSDDASFLPFDRDDRLVVGNCHRIRFRSSAVELFPELEKWPVTPRADSNPSIEVPTASFPETVTADSAIIEYLVFLNRDWSGDPELVSQSKKVIMPWLKLSLTFAAARTPAIQDDVIRRLLDAPIFELRYQDLPWAIDRINILALTGR